MEMKLKLVPIFQYMYHDTESATKVIGLNLCSSYLIVHFSIMLSELSVYYYQRGIINMLKDKLLLMSGYMLYFWKKKMFSNVVCLL